MFTLEKDAVLNDSTLDWQCRETGGDRFTAFRWTVRNRGESAFHGTLRLRTGLPDGFDDPWFMLPGFFYGENRRKKQWSPKLYPRFDAAVSEPRDMTSSYWDFPVDRMACPLVFVHQDTRIFAAGANPHYRLSGYGQSEDPEPQMGVGFGFNGTSGYIRFSIPACDQPFTYNNVNEAPATIRRIRLEPGAELSGTLRVYAFAGDRHDYQKIIEKEYQLISPSYPVAALQEINSLVADAAHGVIAGHYHEEKNYFIYSRPYCPVDEQIANARGITLEWHQMLVGFVGGFPVCYGLMLAADRLADINARRVAIRVADKICQDGISPSGLFRADFMPRTVDSANGSFPNPLFRDREEWGSGWLGNRSWVHSRTIADGCDYLGRMILHEQRHNPGNPSLPLWENALRRNLETVLKLQLDNGCYGQYYDADAGKLAKEDGCGGLLWIPALLNAAEINRDDPEFVRRVHASVRRAGEGYAAYVEAEAIWGAPEDNDSPTSEDGMNAVLAYCRLYEVLHEKGFLDLAVRAADWMLTFRKMYNVIFEPGSLMGKYGFRSRGGDFASASNNHLHVFEVLVTRELCNLSRWTGNPYYRNRARDHWVFVCQFLSRCDGMYNGFRGAMAEQFYFCDYGSWANWKPPRAHVQKGTMAPFTALWCITMILLGAPQAEMEFSC